MPEGLAQKLIEAGAGLIHTATQLPLTESRAIMERATYSAVREHGLQRLPTAHDPLALRHAIIERTAALVRADIIARGIAAATATQVCNEMLTVYRSVRPKDDASSRP